MIITVRKGLKKETESLITAAKEWAFCTGDDKRRMEGKEGIGISVKFLRL